MGEYTKCPECGETNYYEESSHRTFDCGFQGFYDERKKRCKSPSRRTKPTPAISIPHEVARYRLALLDAAQAADAMANDMEAQQVADFPGRCRELARQMREFAGHTADANAFRDHAARTQQTGPGTALSAVFRKRRWF